MNQIPRCLLAFALATPAFAQQAVFDDFARPDSTNLGPNWFEGNGDFVIQSQAARGNIPFANDTWMSHTGFSRPYTQAKADMRFARFPGDPLFAAGLVIGLDPNTWGGVAVLVQDNNLDGLFDRIFFNAAINAGAWFSQGTPIFYDLPSPISAGRLTVWAEDGGDLAVARVEDDAGNLQGVFTAAGIVGTPFAPTGTRAGIWVRGRSICDDFHALEHRSLDAFPSALSLSSGGSAVLDVSLGSAQTGRPYLLLSSLQAATPGLSVGPGVFLPLAIDTLTQWSLQNPNTAPYAATLGLLGPAGHARARLNLPPGSFPSLAGLSIAHAALAIDPSNLTPSAATNAATISLLP